jgi:DNA primase
MQDSAKYLIHADISADGVVERSDVVGAVFGQTEGLLGDELDLRGLQESQKLGRIDVEIESEGGQSFGDITIASGLDRVETAILAAALETIERVGPCRATVQVSELEDVRTAKRREVVERAHELLAEFDEVSLSSQDIVEEVREAVRVEDITEFHGMPAGPRVDESDAVIVVEGRSDVLTLLKYGVKNVIAVEGTDVPDEVARLTRERTTTAFLDGDRGGNLILKELAQVGEIDNVALAPPGRSVEDLSRGEAMTALRQKVPFEAVDESDPDVTAAADADGRPVPAAGTEDPDSESDARDHDGDEGEDTQTGDDPATLAGHVEAVVGADSGLVRLLDDDFATLEDGPVEDAFDLLAGAETTPYAAVLDGELSQRLLDVAAQRGVEQFVAASEGNYVKQPTAVRVRTAGDLQIPTRQ